MDFLKSLRANEPLRTTVYPMLVFLAGMLVATGKIDLDTSNLVLGIIAAVLGVGATEVARSQVTPAINKHVR